MATGQKAIPTMSSVKLGSTLKIILSSHVYQKGRDIRISEASWLTRSMFRSLANSFMSSTANSLRSVFERTQAHPREPHQRFLKTRRSVPYRALPVMALFSGQLSRLPVGHSLSRERLNAPHLPAVAVTATRGPQPNGSGLAPFSGLVG